MDLMSVFRPAPLTKMRFRGIDGWLLIQLLTTFAHSPALCPTGSFIGSKWTRLLVPYRASTVFHMVSKALGLTMRPPRAATPSSQ